MATLTLLSRNNSREEIECPGDTISYVCSVQSNSETVQLKWLVTFPGLDTITFLHVNASDEGMVEYLNMNISSTLIEYRSDEFIESEIVLTVLQNISMNGTILECQSEHLANQSVIVNVNTAGQHH